MRWVAQLAVGLVIAGAAAGGAQPVFRGSEIFPPEEFAARRAKVMAEIGDGVAIAFIDKLKAAAPGSEIRNLDPILNALRAIKSPREIAVIREATRITGLAIIEVMKDTKPGLHEYELQADAECVFKKHAALGPAYFALIATGKNGRHTHVLSVHGRAHQGGRHQVRRGGPVPPAGERPGAQRRPRSA